MMRDVRPGRRGLALTGLGALLGSLVTGIAAWTNGERARPTISVPARRLFAGQYQPILKGAMI
jgi:hypothetical protein